MTPEQAIYTHTARRGGWAIVCSTQSDIDASIAEELRGRATYRKPRYERMADLPAGEEGERLLPPTFSFIPAPALATLIRTVPTGRELSGHGTRAGNSVGHLRFASTVAALRAGTDPSLRPIESATSGCWVSTEPEGELVERGRPIERGEGLDRVHAIRFVEGHPLGTALESLVAAVLDAHFDGEATTAATVCIIEEAPEALLSWMNAIFQVLPVELAWQIGFVTYTPDPAPAARSAPRAALDRGDDGGWSVPLVGSVTSRLNRDSLDARLVIFDFATSELPYISIGPLAEVLLDGWPTAGTALIDSMDELVRAAVPPIDEDGWLVVANAARLRLGHLVDDDDLGEVARWLEAHGDDLGGLVSGVAMAMAPDVLDAGELLALVAAGRRSGAEDVVVAFEQEAMERTVQEAADPSAPAPRVPSIPWTAQTASKASALIERLLASARPGTVGRLLAVADAMALSLSPTVLAGAAQDLVGEWLAAAPGGATPTPDRYGRALGEGIDHWLAAEPPNGRTLERLRAALHDSRLAPHLSSDAVEFPITASLAVLAPGHAEDRVAAFDRLRQDANHHWGSIDQCLETLWGLDPVGVGDLSRIVERFVPPVQSRWVALHLGALVEASTTSDSLERLSDLADRAQVRDRLPESARSRLDLFRDVQRHAREARVGPNPYGLDRLVERVLAMPKPSPAFVRPIAPYLFHLDAWKLAGALEKARAIDAGGDRSGLVKAILDGLRVSAGIGGTRGRTVPLVNIAVGCWFSAVRLGPPHDAELANIIAGAASWDEPAIASVTRAMQNAYRQPGLADEWSAWASANLRAGSIGRTISGILNRKQRS